jgi:hypothetical protein
MRSWSEKKGIGGEVSENEGIRSNLGCLCGSAG